jgi:hypothetical protein
MDTCTHAIHCTEQGGNEKGYMVEVLSLGCGASVQMHSVRPSPSLFVERRSPLRVANLV